MTEALCIDAERCCAIALKDAANTLKQAAIALTDRAVTLKHLAATLTDRTMNLKDAAIALKRCAVAAKDCGNTLKVQRLTGTLLGQQSLMRQRGETQGAIALKHLGFAAVSAQP